MQQTDLKTSFRGGLDLDTSYLQFRKDAYANALNITRDSQLGNQDGIITNIVSNRKVPYNLPTGRCKVIGAESDQLRDRIIYMVWNINNRHCILEFNKTTRIITKILENLTDTGNEDILEFTEHDKINHIEIVHRDEGDLLYFVSSNTNPKGLIIDKVRDGGYTTVLLPFIEAAKTPPLVPAVVAFGDDAAHTTNSLQRKMYQLRYRWVFDDLSKSTFSQWSEVPLPLNVSGADTDIDPTKNNVIFTTVTTGLENVTDIEITARESNGNTWNDEFLVATVNKEELGLLDDAQYQYNFYNDGIFPAIDIRESLLIFDWIPLLAKSMVLANGNVLVYGAITEGYDKMEDIDVTLTTTNRKNVASSTGGATLTYINTGGFGVVTYTITVGGTVATGTRYRVFALIYNSGTATYTQITLSDYTSTSGQTTADIAQQLLLTTSAPYQNGFGASSYFVQLPLQSFIITTQIDYNTTGSEISSQTTWNWYSKYSLGRVYFDRHGVTNGVVYRTGSCDIITGAFQLDSGIPKTPVVSASIDDTPPEWAVKYTWARTKNLTFDRFLYYVTADFQEDTNYYYFCLGNLNYFYEKNSQFIYPAIPVAQGDRIKVLCQANNTGYINNIYTQDYEVLGVVERVITGGSSTDVYNFVKVKKPSGTPSPAYTVNLLTLLYTPAAHGTEEEDNVFFEFGSTYDIYEDGVNRYHRGMVQDQTGSQPATFEFVSGDVYYHRRTCYYDLVPAVNLFDGYYIMDANYSDYFTSAVNSNGRAEPIDVNAKQTYFPATVRFGQEFQPNTNINGLPRFYGLNFKDYNRNFGGISKMWIINQYLFLGQELKIGSVPIKLQIVKTVDQTGQLTASDELLNTVEYYIDEIGVGDCPEAVTNFNWSAYGVDNRRGVIWRWANNGIHVISVLYKINSWATTQLPLRTGNYKVYGTFNARTNQYIAALEQTNTADPYTLVFSEGGMNDSDSPNFETFTSYHSEMMTCLGTLMVTFKNGELWTHDADDYNKFYNTQYNSLITLVFNDNPMIKKVFNAVSYQSNKLWVSPANGDIKTSMINPQTGMQQISQMKEVDFELQENVTYGAYLRDANSMSDARLALVEGDFLNGVWVEQKLISTGSDFVYLSYPYAKWQLSNPNINSR